MDSRSVTVSSSRPAAGGSRGVLEAALAAMQQRAAATLAVVMETEGSTYVRPGALALFGSGGEQVGWLSGGCLEPEIAARAEVVARDGRIEWLDVDTRDDEDLLAGSALGCRGRLHIALLPLQSLTGWVAFIAAWRNGEGRLRLTVSADGSVESEIGGSMRRWQVATASAAGATTRHVDIAPAPTVLVLGAGPETPLLMPLLRSLGWMTTLVERRPRWRPLAAAADAAVEQMPESALRSLRPRSFDAALVMHHNFELDREALAALASSDIAFIGLLGPVRRREDLFRVLSADERAALQPRLHSPIGLNLGGHGPEAIALSIAAQLQTLQQQPYRQVP